jgi:formylglycine-generating enzyme required for sulfatase activity
MSNDLMPDPKRDSDTDRAIEKALRQIAQNSRHLSDLPPQSSDMPLQQGEAKPGFGQKFKSAMKYMFTPSKWRQDRFERQARILAIGNQEHTAKLQAKSQQFRTMELGLLELQRRDNQRFQAEEGDKNRTLSAYLAQAHIVAMAEEGEKNRDMAREIAALQRAVQQEEGRLNRETMLKVEQIRVEMNQWMVERQRETQLELFELNAELMRSERDKDRQQAIDSIKKNKQLSNFPLCAQAEDLLCGGEEYEVPPLLILPSPPTLKFDEKGGGNPLGNSPFAQYFPLMERKLGTALHSLADLYARRGRILRVKDGSWRSKSEHGKTAADKVFAELKSEPGLIIESAVQGKQFFLSTAFWAVGWREPRYESAVTLDWHEALFDAVKAGIAEWQEDTADLSEEEIRESYNLDDIEHNQKIIEREQRHLARGKSFDKLIRNYKISPEDTDRLADFLVALHLLHTAKAADEYFLLWVPFEQRQSPLSPLLPLLLPEYFKDAPPETLAEFTAWSVDFYQAIYTELGREQPNLAELFLEFAISLGELPDKAWAWRQVYNALGVFITLRGGDVEDCQSSTDWQSCFWDTMYSRLTENDTTFVEKLNRALEAIGDERRFDAAEACFARGMKNLALGDPEGLARAVADFTQALNVLSTASPLRTGSALARETYYRRGLAYTGLEQWAEAEDDFSAALTAEARDNTAQSGVIPDLFIYHQRGKTRFEQGKLTEALADAEAAWDLRTASPQRTGSPDEAALQDDMRLFRAGLKAEENRRTEEERKRREAEEKARREAEQQKRRAAEAAKRKAEEEKRSRTHPGNTFRDPLKSGGQGPAMVVIRPGSFQMGGSGHGSGHGEEKPIHAVNIAYPFAIGKTQVTFDEYDAYCAATGKEKPSDQGWGRGKRPVINIYWQEAVDYCAWLSEQTGHTYRLPSEAEWEYACRAGSDKAYCFGDSDSQLGEYAWYSSNAGSKTQPVGKKKANAWGLHDMHGNVWEWCQDDWHSDYHGAPTDGSAWDTGGSSRVLRGGSWYGSTGYCRAASRDNNDDRVNGNGYRVVCVVAPRT